MKQPFTSFTSIIVTATISLLTLTGCLPSKPSKTARPRIALPQPWEPRTVHSDASGADYEYLHLAGPEKGAPTILLLHGGIFDNLVWINCTGLAERFEIVAPRFPDNSLFYRGRVEDWGRIVDDFLTVTNISPQYIAAVSNGAYAAIEYLLHNPDNNVQGLALLSTVMFSVNDEEIKKRTKMARRALGLAPDRMRAIIEHRINKLEASPQTGSYNLQDIFSVRPYPYYYEVFSVAKNQGARRQDTRRISVPVVVVHGSNDELMPIWAARLTTDAFPNAVFHEVQEAAHPMVFTHGDTIAQLLIKHL